MDRQTEIKDVQHRLLRSADNLMSIRIHCAEIRTHAKNIALPKLTLDEIQGLRIHLQNHTKIKSTELKYKFLNLRNAFLIIREMEDNIEMRKKLEPIIKYLYEFKLIFDLIIESQNKKETRELEIVMQLLNFEIDLFCIKYSRILDEDNDIIFNTKMRKENTGEEE